MKAIIGAFARAAAGAVAVLAVGAVNGIASPAYADAALPDLSVSFQSDPVAEVNNLGTTVGMYLYNYGQAQATGVTITIDASDVTDRVAVSVPDWADNCELTGAVVACRIGVLAVDQVVSLSPVTLASKPRATPGDAGSVTVTIRGAEGDAEPTNNTVTFPVTVIPSGPDLVASAADVGSATSRVGPGDTKPLRAAVRNEGDTTTAGITVIFQLPTWATFGERYSDCVYEGDFPGEPPAGFIYGPSRVTCTAPLELAPDETLPLFDDETGEALFTAKFGRNMAGPDDRSGYFEVQLAGERALAKAAARNRGGSSFAAKVKARLTKAGVTASEELDTSDNLADFKVWSKPNSLDVSVSVAPVTAKVGDTVTVTAIIANNGPSDGGGPVADITAPAGTVLLPTAWCRAPGADEPQPESRKLHCNFESEWPAVASGNGRVTLKLRVKVKSTPGTDGTVSAASAGVGSTESNPANNTARLVINPPGGGGGGLPITGSRTQLVAGLGAAMVLVGAVLYALGRRRLTPSSDGR